jgi:hypothetical protein
MINTSVVLDHCTIFVYNQWYKHPWVFWYLFGRASAFEDHSDIDIYELADIQQTQDIVPLAYR